MSSAEGLTVERVHVWRGDRHVLKGVSCAVRPGELLHVRGPNGTGKTTLLRVICGLLRPEQGEVRWQGELIGRVRASFERALAYASHEPALKGDLTAFENLRFTVGLKRRVTRTQLEHYLARTGIAALGDLPVRVLSAGQRRRVALARILALESPLWLLDEPYTHLDVAGAELLSGLLREHRAQGGLALIVAHHEVPAVTNQLELAA
jgi:heme exporter protein A